MTSSLPAARTVAIVGRPNVGKSTLFNRLVGKRMALVHDRPGVTRDRREGEARLGDLLFTVVDTAGFDEAADPLLEGRMRKQTEMAVKSADVTVFVIDARAGVTTLDESFAALLRRANRPIVLVANKCEGRGGDDGGLADAFALGFGEPVPLSAEHGEGMSDLYEHLAPYLSQPALEDGEAPEGEASETPPLRLAIVGRPNVGKSSLINRLIGNERLVTGPEAGITRDAIAVPWIWRGKAVRLFDTAGLRKRAKVVDAVERLSTADTLRAIRFAEVVLLMVDATQPFEKQDMTIADLIVREGRALVVVVNKWDLVEDQQALRRELRMSIDERLPQARGVPLAFVSALTGSGLDKIMPTVTEAHRRWNARVATAALNRWLEIALERHAPPLVQGRRLKLRYATQVKTRPPTFALFTSRPTEMPEAYLRYLTNSLRDDCDLDGVPIRLMLRKGKNPFMGEE